MVSVAADLRAGLTIDRNRQAGCGQQGHGEATEGPTSSLYAMTVRFSLEVSTQVTKSSICLKTG